MKHLVHHHHLVIVLSRRRILRCHRDEKTGPQFILIPARVQPCLSLLRVLHKIMPALGTMVYVVFGILAFTNRTVLFIECLRRRNVLAHDPKLHRPKIPPSFRRDAGPVLREGHRRFRHIAGRVKFRHGIGRLAPAIRIIPLAQTVQHRALPRTQLTTHPRSTVRVFFSEVRFLGWILLQIVQFRRRSGLGWYHQLVAVIQPHAGTTEVLRLDRRLMVIAKVARANVAGKLHQRRGALLLCGREVRLGPIARGATGVKAPEPNRLGACIHFALHQWRQTDAVQRTGRWFHTRPGAQSRQHVAGHAVHFAHTALFDFCRPFDQSRHADAAFIHGTFLRSKWRDDPAVAARAAVVAAIPQHRVVAQI